MFRTPLASVIASFVVASSITAPVWAQADGESKKASPAELRYYAIEAEIALSNSRHVDHLGIQVESDTAKGTLALKGNVPSAAARRMAERIVRQALSSSDVELVNQIRVAVPEAEPAPPGVPTPLDEEQMKKLRGLLEDEFPKLIENISVTFDVQPMPTIVLEGLVPSYEQKLEISRFVRSHFKAMPVINNIRVRRMQEGERSFYIVNAQSPQDRVEIEKPKLPPENGNATATASLDARIAKQLGATLSADPVIKSAQMTIRVEDGVVWLGGQVESQGQKIRAIRLASNQPGVRYVVNQLAIRPPSGEPSGVIIQVAEPTDVRAYIERYVDTRVPELRGAAVDVKDHTIIVTPPEGVVLDETEVRNLQQRLEGLPEMKGFEVIVRVSADED